MSGAIRPRRAAWLAAWVLLAASFAAPASAKHINVITVDGSINPASADHILQALAQSESDGAVALLIQLDTPGGLLASTKDIVQGLLNSTVPVIVYVSPSGAWAASAGSFITMAANVAAMAPGTSIGAASPIGVGGSGGERGKDNQRTDVAAEKTEKFTIAFIEAIAKERHRNVEWAMRAVREAEAVPQDEALKLGVIDLVARNRAELLEKVQGMEVQVQGKPVKLDVAGADLRFLEMTSLQRLFNFLASPDVAVLLVMAGLLGLYIEFQQPGMLLPGILGAVCLVLAAIAFQILPFSWVGLLLVLLGVGLIALEVFVTSYGLLFAAGIACFLLGGTMLFDVPEMDGLAVSFWSVLVPAVAGFALFAGIVVFAVGRSLRRRQTAGVGDLVGMVGRSDTALEPEGRVFVRGEYWTATADENIPAGDRVEITAVEGMRLRVRRATQG
jgi:membrane-bound serine protease (ClpP class)